MRRKRALGAVALAVTLLSAFSSSVVLAAASPNVEEGDGCYYPSQTSRYAFGFKTRTSGNLIKQHDIHENYSGRDQTITFEFTSSTSVTDSAKVTGSFGGSIGAVFANFEGKVGAELGYIGQVTSFARVSKTSTLKSGDTYIFYAGIKRHIGYYDWFLCESDYRYHKGGTIDVFGYLSRVQGLVGCEQATDPGTMARTAKALFCG